VAGDNAAEFQFKLGIVDGKLLDVNEVKRWRPCGQGRAVLEAAVPDQCAGPAVGDSSERNRRDLAVVLGQGVEKEKFATETAAA